MDGIVSVPSLSEDGIISLPADGMVSVPILSGDGMGNVVSLPILEEENVIEKYPGLNESFESEQYETEAHGYHVTPGKL